MNKYWLISRGARIVSALLLVFVVKSAIAEESGYARVISSTPVYKPVEVNTPVQKCQTVTQPLASTQYNSQTSTILGGIVGAAVGSQFGGGSGKDWATASGALLGGSIGRDYERKRRSRQILAQEICSTVNVRTTEVVIDHYNVIYEYANKIYSTTMSHQPGATISVSVGVVPN